MRILNHIHNNYTNKWKAKPKCRDHDYVSIYSVLDSFTEKTIFTSLVMMLRGRDYQLFAQWRKPVFDAKLLL